MGVKLPCQHGDIGTMFAAAGPWCQTGTVAADAVVRTQNADLGARRVAMNAMLRAVGPDLVPKRRQAGQTDIWGISGVLRAPHGFGLGTVAVLS
jgi:hypothetical protein